MGILLPLFVDRDYASTSLLQEKFLHYFAFTIGRFLGIFGPIYLMWMLTIVLYI